MDFVMSTADCDDTREQRKIILKLNTGPTSAGVKVCNLLKDNIYTVERAFS